MIGNLEVIVGEEHEYSESPRSGGTLRIMLPGDDNNLDFSPASFRQDFQIMSSYLDPLVWIDDVTMEPRPWLAESWDWSNNNRVVTMRLADGITWHDGSPLHARDVVFSLYVYRDDVDSGVRNLFTMMEAAEVVDRRTVRIALTASDGNWLLNAASQLIFQEAQYEDYWNARPIGQRTLTGFSWRTSTPIGTGPWRVGQRRATGVDFTANDDYWAGPPHFESLQLDWSPESDARLQAWNTGEADLLSPIVPEDLPRVSNREGRLYASNGVQVMFAAFNFDNPTRDPADLLQDNRLRQALTLAVDRNRYAGDVFNAFVRQDAAGTVAQPWAHDDAIENPPRDPGRARQLLVEAGFEDRDDDGIVENAAGTPLALSVIVRQDSPFFLQSVLQNVMVDLAEVGIRLTIRSLPPDEFTSTWTTTRDYDLIAYTYRLYPGFTDYDLYGSNWDIRINPQGWNPGGYENEEADQAIRRILISVDPNQQRSHLYDLQEAVNDDLFGLWFGFPDDLVLVREGIAGFQPNKYLPTWNTRLLWDADAPETDATPVPIASPTR
jgi:peptide/nickel transport system substrate-binding protein